MTFAIRRAPDPAHVRLQRLAMNLKLLFDMFQVFPAQKRHRHLLRHVTLKERLPVSVGLIHRTGIDLRQ